MTGLRTAAQQALEALESVQPQNMGPLIYPAITALRAALADQYCDTHCTWADHAPGCELAEPVQEPVAWLVTTEMQDGTRRTYPMTGRLKDAKDACDFGEPAPLYFAPPQRKPLTDEEIKDRPDQGATYVEGYGYVDTRAVRAVERAHGIGEGA